MKLALLDIEWNKNIFTDAKLKGQNWVNGRYEYGRTSFQSLFFIRFLNNEKAFIVFPLKTMQLSSHEIDSWNFLQYFKNPAPIPPSTYAYVSVPIPLSTYANFYFFMLA